MYGRNKNARLLTGGIVGASSGTTGRRGLGSVPTALFATLDPTEVSETGLTFSPDNLQVSGGGHTSWRGVRSDFSIPDNGKVYYEWVNPTGAELTMVGVTTTVPSSTSWYPGLDANSWGAFQFSAQSYDLGWYHQANVTGHTDANYTVPAYAVGMVAVDRSTGKIHYGIDGQWWTSTTTLGTFQAYTVFTNIPSTGALYPAISSIYANNMQYDGVLNFGQDHTFAGKKTALVTPYTDANGLGEFYYEPPAGFTGLYTTIPTPLRTRGYIGAAPAQGGMLTLYDRYIDNLT